MILHDVIQGSDEWKALRLGIVTASEMFKIISPKGEKSKQAGKYQNKLIAEIIAGKPIEEFTSDYMNRGKELEDKARQSYQTLTGQEVTLLGFVTTDDGRIGVSPDGYLPPDGGLELKCPKIENHIENILYGDIVSDYYPQIQANIYVMECQWWDIISFHSDVWSKPIRVERDNGYIESMLDFVNQFYEGLEEKKAIMREKGYKI
jgi:hypothetical protein